MIVLFIPDNVYVFIEVVFAETLLAVPRFCVI